MRACAWLDDGRFSRLRSALASADALVLEGVARAFGALGRSRTSRSAVAAGERRAVLGANGAGKTTLFNAITGDFPPTAGPHPLLRRGHHRACRRMSASGAGLRRTYQISLLFRGLTVRDNLFLARRGVTAAASASSGRAPATRRAARRRTCSNAPPRAPGASGWSRSCRTAQQRQLEIGMALAGAPRLILFDEPAAGLSPGERRELVALLTALARRISATCSSSTISTSRCASSSG